MHTNLSSTFQLVYKFVHPWPPRWCTNLYILDLLGGVQICTPLTSQVVYKFVHPWPPRWCTNLYILDRTSQMVYKFVHPRPPTSQIANYLNICDTGLHRTTKKQECWWCWSFNSECWRSCCCVLWKLCTRASYGQCTQIFDNTIEVRWMEAIHLYGSPGRCEMPKIVGK